MAGEDADKGLALEYRSTPGYEPVAKVTARHSATLSPHEERRELAHRLRLRAGEIEGAIFHRVVSLSGQSQGKSADYTKGVREAVAEAMEYAFGAIEHGQEWHAQIPIAAIAQAHRAARAGVSLDTVLRRYSAGDRELTIYVNEEADGLPYELRQEIARTQSPSVDRIMEVVAEEYEDELERIRRYPSSGLINRMNSLLDGDLTVDLGPEYDIGGWHVAIVSSQAGAKELFQLLARELDACPLFTQDLAPSAYVWLGRRGGLDVHEIQGHLEKGLYEGRFALGESREGAPGWRLSHFEARAAFDAMPAGRGVVSRGRDFVVVAAVMKDPLLTEALLASYATPLNEDGDVMGADLRQTARAYFATGQQASAAAETLGVDRRTVRRRLQAIEERLGQRIEDCHAQLQIALDVDHALRSGRIRL